VTTIAVSSLTFFSGFGLGTLLLPVFLLFFPVNTAIAATAIVHLANNIFKALLIGGKANLKVVAFFSLPAACTAVLGALLLEKLGELPPLYHYELLGRLLSISPINLIVAVLMAGFAYLELNPRFQELSFPPKWLPAGGALSGFFGGLSGHQGALRSAFLARLNLTKEEFIGSNVISAIAVDVARLIVYGMTFFSKDLQALLAKDQAGLIICGILSALLGAVAGARLIKKITMRAIQRLIGNLLVIYAVLLGLGII